MKKSFLLLGSLAVFALCTKLSFAHGGTYRGPGDTVPPSGPGPTTGGPTGPGPSGPTTPGPSGPSAPSGPGPSTGAPSGPAPTGPKTGGPGGVVTPDLSLWTFWWEFNKDPFLNLKAAIHSGGVTTGSDDYYMGREGTKGARDSLKPTESQIRGKVVPALLKALEEETNNDIVTGCMIALGKIGGDPSFVDVIKKQLKNLNQEISESAALALGILSYPNSIEPLTHLIHDDKEGRALVGGSEVKFRTRAFAVYGLGLIGYSVADEAVKAECIKILREVLQSDRSSQKDIKVGCIIALSLIKDADRKAVEDIKRVLEDDRTDKIIRAHCPLALAKLLGTDHPVRKQVVKQLVALLQDRKEKDFVRQSAVYALGMMVRPGEDIYEEAIKGVETAVKETNDEQERNFAMISLGKMGGPEAQNFLLQQLTKSKMATVRPWAALGLGILAHNLKEAGQTPDKEIIDKLQELLSQGGNPSTVGAYAIALGICRDHTAKDLLLETMKKVKEDELKGYCCVALGLVGARETVSEIQDVVKKATRKPDLLRQAAVGLGLLGDKKVVLDLVALMKESKAASVLSALASALGFIGDQRSIDPLIEGLQDKSLQPLARGLIASALGIVCDDEMYPWNSKIAVDMNYRAAVTTLTDASGSTGICDIL